MIMQAILLLNTHDKDVDSFSLKVGEWYSWHLPELVKINVDDNYFCAKVSKLVSHATNGVQTYEKTCLFDIVATSQMLLLRYVGAVARKASASRI